MSRDTLDWWRMRRPASDDSSQCVAAVLARASWAGTTVQALDEAREALVGVAELGFLKGSGEMKRLAELSRRLERYELRAVAETLSRLVAGEPAEGPARLLRATHVVERAQALTRTLPWLHPC